MRRQPDNGSAYLPLPPAVNRNRAGLIGRGTELARLNTALSNALDGKPAMVFMGGEAGVGKTRLLRELSLAAQKAGARVVAGACVDLGDLPYAPLVDALRSLVRDIGLDRLRQLAGSGFASLTRLAPFLGDFIAEPGDVDAPEQHARSRLFEAVLHLFGQLSAETPVLVIIEDLHWADRSTLDFLSFLLKALTEERLLVVASYRSNELHPRHPLRPVVVEIDRARRAERFELHPFDLDELRLFLEATLGEEPRPALVRQLFELSDGNPFFAEELVAGRVLDEVAASDPVAAPGRRRVPQPLRDVLLARVEMMSDEAQEVLRAAATAGRHVSHRLIATVCDLPERALLTALRECVVQHLLAVSLGEDAYAFRHALAREAVYEDLLPGERIRLHTAIARALNGDASLAGSQSHSVATELAHHWHEAGNRERALAASVTAGRDAAVVWAFVESESQYSRALALWQHVEDPERLTGMTRLELLNRAADAARWSGHVDRAIEWTREALAASDGSMRAAAYERLGRYLSDAGNSDAALEAYTAADELLAGAPPSALAAAVRAARAGVHVQAGQYSLGLRLSTEAVDMARAVGALAVEGRALNTRGVALTMTGQPDAGVPALRSAVELAQRSGDLEELLRAYANLTFVLENAGRLREALQAARRGIEESKRLGVQSEASGALLTVSAILQLELGQWSEAEAIAHEVLGRDTPARVALYFQLWLAEIDVYRGRLDEARERLDANRETLHLLKEQVSTGTWYACRAELAIWQRDHATVRSTIAQGLAAVGDAEDAPQVLRLCSYGLRAEADEAQRLSAMGGAESLAAALVREIGADLTRRAERVARPDDDTPVLPEVSVLALQCRAERSRLDGLGDGEAWAEVASGWKRLERPYPYAYAAWRHAESLLDGPDRDPRRAAPILREAHWVTVDLGAEPLRQEIVALARRARIDLSEPVADEPRPVVDQPADPFGLTPRERQVLTYLGQGHTNKRIARELFISEKTASVHVSNILAKLQVTNRSEAAAVARRLGLIE
jgi:DNA-binding CsgD family transcriptional regulator/tetratricopeptide (TPR) repeat protein